MTAQVGTGTLADGASGWLGTLAQYRAVWSSPDFITSAATILLIAAAWLVSLGGIGIGLPVDEASWLASLAGHETDWLAPALGLAGRRYRRGQDRRWRGPRAAGAGAER